MTTTLRDLFNLIRTHLLTQNRKSGTRDEDGKITSCLYRGPDGTSCAVGCLIKDEHYTPELEHKLCDVPIVMLALELSLGFKPSLAARGMLRDLQSIHDDRPVAVWYHYFADYERAQGAELDRSAVAS